MRSIQVLMLAFLLLAGSPAMAGGAKANAKAGVRYFPTGTFDDFRQEWYGRNLQAMGEPVLKREAGVQNYRFIWLRTFHHPIAIRITRNNGKARLIAVELGGAGGYDPGKPIRRIDRDLSAAEFADVEATLQKQGFWNLPTEDKQRGLDGAEWIFEGSTDRYHVVSRWSPDSGPMRKLGGKLFGLTHWKLAKDEIY